MAETRRSTVGGVAFVAFLGCVPLANWLILHAGTVCVPNGPCLVPVASGVLTVGVALVLRNVVQRCSGLRFGQIIGKARAVLIAMPLVRLPRRVAPAPA